MSPSGKVREHIGTKSRNQVKNPTTNPTTFLVTHKEVSLMGKKASHSNQSREIPQHQVSSHNISKNPTTKSHNKFKNLFVLVSLGNSNKVQIIIFSLIISNLL